MSPASYERILARVGTVLEDRLELEGGGLGYDVTVALYASPDHSWYLVTRTGSYTASWLYDCQESALDQYSKLAAQLRRPRPAG